MRLIYLVEDDEGDIRGAFASSDGARKFKDTMDKEIQKWFPNRSSTIRCMTLQD